MFVYLSILSTGNSLLHVRNRLHYHGCKKSSGEEATCCWRWRLSAERRGLGGDERRRIISSEEDGWFNASASCTFLNKPHKNMWFHSLVITEVTSVSLQLILLLHYLFLLHRSTIFLTFLLYIWEMDKCMLKQRANRFFPLVFLRSVFGWNTSKYRTFVIAATRTHKRSSFSKCCSLASHQHTHHLNFSLIQPLVLPHWFSLMIGGGCIHTCSCYGEWSLQYTEELCHGLYLSFLIQRSSIKLQLHCSSTKMLKYTDLCCLWWPEI